MQSWIQFSNLLYILFQSSSTFHQRKQAAEPINENSPQKVDESRKKSKPEESRRIPNGHEKTEDGTDSIKKSNEDLDVSVSKGQISYK